MSAWRAFLSICSFSGPGGNCDACRRTSCANDARRSFRESAGRSLRRFSMAYPSLSSRREHNRRSHHRSMTGAGGDRSMLSPFWRRCHRYNSLSRGNFLEVMIITQLASIEPFRCLTPVNTDCATHARCARRRRPDQGATPFSARDDGWCRRAADAAHGPAHRPFHSDFRARMR